MTRHRLLIVGLALCVVLGYCAVVEACPGCAEAQAGQGADRANIVRGYFWSIVFMMSMPFLLVGSFGTYCYLQFRKARASQTTSTAKTTAVVTAADVRSAHGAAPPAAPVI